MKNFLEQQAINYILPVDIKISTVHFNGFPDLIVQLNGSIIHKNTATKQITLKSCISIKSSMSLVVTMFNKKYSASKESAIIIESVTVDGIEIIPCFNHLTEYNTDIGPGNSTNYLGRNGTWKLTTNAPFYNWLHMHTGQGWLLTPT